MVYYLRDGKRGEGFGVLGLRGSFTGIYRVL